MVKRRIASAVISMVMALTVFSFPTGVFAVESEAVDGLQNRNSISTQELAPWEPENVQKEADDNNEEEWTDRTIAADEVKYEPYLSFGADADEPAQLITYVDYDCHRIDGYLPNLDRYNRALREEGGDASLQITIEDIRSLIISVGVNGKTYTGKVEYPDDESYFSVGFPKVPAGTPVTVSFQMGTYTKTEELIVSKAVTPTVTVKNRTYDGKYHTGALNIKVGKETLKEGTDYEVDSESIKDVGYGWIGANSKDSCKYRFCVDSEAFAVNPKGTAVRSVKSKGNAVTVKWASQAAKMSKARINGYQIQLATNKAFTKNQKLIPVKGYKTISKKVKNLKANTTYYVRVRTYMACGNDTLYSSWSKAKAVKLKDTVKTASPVVKQTKVKAKKSKGSAKLSATSVKLVKGGTRKIAISKGNAKWSVKGNGVIKIKKKTKKYVIVTPLKAGNGIIYCKAGKKKLQCKVKVINNKTGTPEEDLGNAIVVGMTGEVPFVLPNVPDSLRISSTIYNKKRGTVKAKIVRNQATGEAVLKMKVKALKPGKFNLTIKFKDDNGKKSSLTGEFIFIKNFRGKAKVKKTAANYRKWRKSVISTMVSSDMSTWQIIDAIGTLISTGNYSNKGGATGMQLWYGGNGTCISGAQMMHDFMNDLGIRNKVHKAGYGGAKDIFGYTVSYWSQHKNTWVTLGGKTYELNPQPGLEWPYGTVAR